MNFYKLIRDKEFIGIATSYDLRKYQRKHNIILTSDEKFAQYIQCNDKLYRDDWFAPIITNDIDFEVVSIVSISEEEFNDLSSAIEKNEEIVVDNDMDSVINIEQPTDPIDETTVEFVMSKKISEMSKMCNSTISAGFDIILGDGVTHHFSLTTQDQLNLMMLESMIDDGETNIPYHADGELCKFYSVDDIYKILSMSTKFKTYQTAYFNSLKSYIKSLQDISVISNITYGVEIPSEYMTDVLKTYLM